MHQIINHIRKELSKAADPLKAPQMQAYIKTDQPFYGVQSTARKTILRKALKKYPITNKKEWEQIILEFWNGKYHEEMYIALSIADRFKKYRDEDSWELFEKLLRSATNWDTVDGIAPNLLGDLVKEHRYFEKKIWEWTDDENFWVRRATILVHLKHKEDTNVELLAKTILKLAHEKEFFIRKAIGWALRQYSYTDADWVKQFISDNEEKLSGLSKREGLKAINRKNNC